MQKRTLKPRDIDRAESEIAGAAEAYPNVIETGPWGHRAFKTNGKTFLFMSTDTDGLSLSVKLPVSGKAALSLGFTEPTHYGLGKSGWVTARFAPGDEIPLPKLIAWLDESFRAIAPKKVVSGLADSKAKVSPKSAPVDKPSAKSAPAEKAPAKRAPKKAPAKSAPVKKASPKKAPGMAASRKSRGTKR